MCDSNLSYLKQVHTYCLMFILKQPWKQIFSLCCDWRTALTMLLPLQTLFSIFLDKQKSVFSIFGCFPLWLPPSWLPGCRLVTSQRSLCSPGSHNSWGSSLSLSTFILMQLPAFLRAVTAPWWVTSCILRPLTWKAVITLSFQGSVKVRPGVRGETLNHALTHSISK